MCIYVYVYCCWLAAKPSLTLLWSHGPHPTMLLCPWDFPGKNIGVGCHLLLQRIFLTQGSNWHLLHWQADSLSLSHQETFLTQRISRHPMVEVLSLDRPTAPSLLLTEECMFQKLLGPPLQPGDLSGSCQSEPSAPQASQSDSFPSWKRCN